MVSGAMRDDCVFVTPESIPGSAVAVIGMSVQISRLQSDHEGMLLSHRRADGANSNNLAFIFENR